MTHGSTSVFTFASSSSHRGGKGSGELCLAELVKTPLLLVLRSARSWKLAFGSCISPAPSTQLMRASSVPANKAGLTLFAAS
jgi:hypothetical protein